MKKLFLLLALLPSIIFGQSANDLILTQRNAAGTQNSQRNVPTQGAISTTLASYLSSIGLGTEDSPAFTGLSATSPAFTTSITTPSTTFALANTTATTINAFGAATTVNTGAAATQIWNFGGSTTASEFRFLEPSGSGTNYSAFKAVAQGANITYSLPPTVGAAGTFLTDVAGNGVLTWGAPAGSGTVTVVASGALTSTALVTGGGTTTLQTPSATSTLDASGNMSLAGTLTSGTAAGATGIVTITGLTSGSLKITGADAMAQIVTVSAAAQTSGASTLTIPDQAGVSRAFVFDTLAQTLTNKVLTSATITTGLVPTSNDGAALGSTTNQFSDLFLAEGGVINWDNGDATLTQAGNLVTLAGANLAAVIDTTSTATTQAASTNNTTVATTAYADRGAYAAQLGTYATPDTTAGAVTLASAVTEIWTNTTTEYDLPAVATSTGKAIIFYVVGTNVVTIDPNASEIIVRDGTAQTGGVTMTLTGTAGNYVAMVCDGTRWVTLGFKGTLAAGS